LSRERKKLLIRDDVINWAINYDGPKFHAMLCDPPYNLDTMRERFGKEGSAPPKHGKDGAFDRLSSGFLGQEWDTDIAFELATWHYLGTVLHPGALCMAYTHARTYHRIASAIEDAGFTIYPMIGWINAQGFPHPTKLKSHEGYYYNRNALKGALEPIVVFQKEYEGTLKENIETTGAGSFWIEGSRIEGDPVPINKLEEWSGFGEKKRPKYTPTVNDRGRWPANVVIDEGIGEPYETYFFTSKPSKKETGENRHPTAKPIALNEHLATMLLPPGDFKPRRIFNPFSGSGSEMLGAIRAGWDDVVGVELEDKYCDMAIERLRTRGYLDGEE
jgi:site-specific DNA-methyltransferase (adenine-specific)